MRTLIFILFMLTYQSCSISQDKNNINASNKMATEKNSTEPQTKKTMKKATLIYVGDPMCSWCYGISPELNKAVETLGDQVDLQLVMGGLRPYNTETMLELGDFLNEHWEEVHERSKQPFNYDILKDHSFVYDTEPSCRAVVVVRSMDASLSYPFFKGVQKLFYFENKNTNEVATYQPLVEELGLDYAAFKKAFESEEMKLNVKEDFKFSGNLGVRGFPSLILKYAGDAEDEYFAIANGYEVSENIIAKVRKVLGE